MISSRIGYPGIALSCLVLLAFLAGCRSQSQDATLASAKDYLAKQDYRAAVIQLKNVLEKTPESAETRFLLGKALIEIGDAASEVELRKARDLKYPVDQVTAQLQRFHIASGQYKRVVDEAATVIGTTPAMQAELQTNVSMAHAFLGNRAAAEKANGGALEAKADFIPARINKARLDAGRGDSASALATLDSVIAAEASNSEAWKTKGDVHMLRVENDAAIAAFRKALSLRPGYLAAHFRVASLLIAGGKIDEAAKEVDVMRRIAPVQPLTLLVSAQIAYLRKDFKAAREFAQTLLKVAPNEPSGLLQAGLIEFQLKSYDRAENLLAKVVQTGAAPVAARRALTVSYLTSGLTAKAIATLAPILPVIDKDPDMLALAGETYLMHGDLKRAEDYFTRAAALDPKDNIKRTAVATTRMARGDTDTAVVELEQISAGDAAVTADMALISFYLRRGQHARALKAIDSLEKKQPTNVLAPDLRGRVLMQKGDAAGARANFERTLAINPAYLPGAVALANLDLSENKPDEARRRFEGVLVADPKNVKAMIAIAELRRRAGGPVDEVAGLLSKAVAAGPNDPAPRSELVGLYLRAGDSKKAVAVAQDAVAAMPSEPEVYEMLGQAHLAAADHNQALATFAKLSALQPLSTRPYLLMANANVAAKNPVAAAQNLRRALELKPDAIEAQQGLALLDLQTGKGQTALAIAREVQKQRPGEATGYLLEGDIGAVRKSWAEAASAYRAGLKQIPAPEIAIKLHMVLVAAGNKGEADRFAAGWVRDKPRELVFRQYLGESAATRKEYETAAAHFKAILEVQPDNVAILNNVAWIGGELKDPKALEYAEKADKLAPNHPAIMSTMATLLGARGETTRAMELAKKAVGIAPQYAEARLAYARLLLKSGNKAEARVQLAELAKLGDRFAEQAEVTGLMKDL